LRLALASALLVAIGCSDADRLPDVVLITLDTTRADHLGVYGYPRPVSPVINRLASESVVYDHAWTVSSWSLPAHASIFTGLHPTTHGAHFDIENGSSELGEVIEDHPNSGVRVNRLSEDVVTLAEMLQERGYVTAAFAGGPWLAPPFGLLQGYQLQDADVSTLTGRHAAELTKRASAWIAGVPANQPLHLLVNYFDPHSPYHPPRRFTYLARGLDPDRPLDHDANSNPLIVDAYDGEIRFMDHQIGRLFEFLRDHGRYENTLIVVVADHGEMLGEHGLTGHPTFHYEPLLRVPLIVRFPGGRGGGRRIDTPVSVVDLLPLIAGELGLELPGEVEGVAVGERRSALAQTFRDPVSIAKYGERADHDLATLIRWPWKLTRSDDGATALRHLERDPLEERTVADPSAVRDLSNELDAAIRGLPAPTETATPARVSQEEAESLRALGYLE
jgi:arylsulfatase A-like enzyme